MSRLAASGWIVDHETSLATFVYTPHRLELADLEHGGDEDSNGSRPYPTQMSILFVNQLPALPLEAYSIATYQHVGAAATSVSISLLSDGDVTADEAGTPGEPRHPGLSQLGGMVSLLENQFQAMKTQWRAVSSIHRMQSVVIENQILNMLGIFAVMPQALQTTTLPDSPNLVQAGFLCSQYENVFEQLTPFQVKGVGLYNEIWQNEVFANSPAFQAAVKQNALLEPLADLVRQMNEGKLEPLFEYLVKDPSAPLIPGNFALSAREQFELIDKNLPLLKMAYPKLGERVQKGTSLNFNDVLALSLYSTAADKTFLRWYMEQTRAAAKSPGAPNPVKALYQAYINWSVANTATVSSAVQQFEAANTDLGKKLAGQVDPKGPGSHKGNLDHVAYRDLGLYDLNDAPGNYFVDYSADARNFMEKISQSVSEKVVDSANIFNQRAPTSGADIQSSEAGVAPNPQDPKEIQEQVSSILQSLVYPTGNMARAFPTYKLFLIEDDNLHTYYMFDDFYSYASVLNIEIIRYLDKPDTAVIQVSNLANLLMHKLFDSSVEGRFEFQNAKALDQVLSNDGGAIANLGGVPTRDQAGKTLGGYTYQYNKLWSGFDNSGDKRVPLQYFALQTGTKIQVRMGYTNNPDELEPVFSGIVTQVDPGPVLTITAQGFAVELVDFDPEVVGQQKGGVFRIQGGGEAVSVMGAMVDTVRAKHFGHWQVNVPAEKSLRGYNYIGLAGGLAEARGAKTFSTLLLTNYDRACSGKGSADGRLKSANTQKPYTKSASNFLSTSV